MNYFLWIFSLGLLLPNCHRTPSPVVDPLFADSMVIHYRPTVSMQAADSNLVFWQKRMDSLPDNYVNGPKYAAALTAHFRLYGDISDLRKADSLVRESSKANLEKDPGTIRSLASMALLQHQFTRADSLLKIAVLIEGQTISNAYLDFDIAFETGRYARAKDLLKTVEKDRSYGYLFRRSKYEHYNGSLDSAIDFMLQAVRKAGNNTYLQQAALSNAADLCVHQGKISKACELYVQSTRLDPSDLHSIMGLGWIALVEDKNDTLAENIFNIVRRYNHAPDVLLKLQQVAEMREDSVMQVKYANEFAALAADSRYDKMYSKYLIDLYTGILDRPAKAVELAEQETYNRPTPQVFAWYAWALFCNGEKDKAYSIFKSYISQQPLEALELYYMGKMMQGSGKGYNAQQFFKAAYKNRYDLSPVKVKDLVKNL